MGRDDLRGCRVAIPGHLTTAHLALKLWLPEVETLNVAFDQIFEVVKGGKADAGVVIHEGQLTFQDEGLYPVVDLGKWWFEDTGGPLPLGANGIRKDLPIDVQRRLCKLLTASIDYALNHRREAMEFAIRYARDLEEDPERSDKFVGMYVNEWTRDYGEAGRRAVQELLDRGSEAGILSQRITAEFLDFS